jgi:hypothetical protein
MSIENEVEELNLQVGLVILSSDDDKIQEREQQVNHAELNQQETQSLHIPEVVQEQFDHMPLQ